MMKSKRFELIRDIASGSAQDLSRAMADAQRRVADCECRLEQLKTFREDYVRKSTQSTGTMDAVKLLNYRSFLDRLGDAMRQQQGTLGAARVDYEKHRNRWSAKRIEAESLGKVADRLRREERHDAERREQRDGDEAAMRASFMRLD